MPKTLTPINKQLALKFWNFVDSGDDEADLYVYGDIINGGGWIYEWFGMEATDQVEFIKNLNALGTKKNINVYINSLGGDVWAAQTIHNVLKRNPANITVYIDGIAASAASIIAMAGDKIIMPLNAQLMIHDPLLDLYGYFNAADLETMKGMLDQIKAGIVAAYMTKSNLSDKEISKLMSKQTYLTAKQAVELGFADEILYDKSVEVINAGRFVIVNSLALDISKLQANPFIKQNERDDLVDKTTQTTQTVATVVSAPQVVDVIPPVQQTQTQQTQTVDAAAAERQRLQDIDAIAAGIDPALVNEAKYINPINANELAFRAMKEGKVTNQGALTAAIQANKAAGVDQVAASALEQTQDREIDLSTSKGLNTAYAMIAANSQAGRQINFARR